MALAPVLKEYRAAALGVAMAGALAISGLAAHSSAAHAQTAPPAATEEPMESITVKECFTILRVSSEIVSDIIQGQDTAFKGKKWDPVFAESLAGFIAPAKPAPFLQVILAGNFRETVNSKTDAGLAWLKTNIPSMTCSGDSNIVTPDGLAVVAALSIAEKLRLQPQPIYLRLKGVKFVKPPEVVSRQPGGIPTVPAALRPRTELILENSKR
jgi:hypothetical protein